MATLQATTASNWPHINPDGVAAVEAIIADYDFIGAHDTLTVTVTDPTDEDPPSLKVAGYASFDVSKPLTDDEGTVVDREYCYTEEFLERISPYLEEQLVVETVGFEKCRFPLLAGQWVAWPDGTVVYNSFDHSPDKPTATDSDAGTVHSAINFTESSN
jgi:hypothetical protein